jgi:hypothetical protein
MSQDYISRTKTLQQLSTGESPSTDDIAGKFALHGLRRRVEILAQIDSEEQPELETESEMRAALGRVEIRNRLGQVHEALRKSGR